MAARAVAKTTATPPQKAAVKSAAKRVVIKKPLKADGTGTELAADAPNRNAYIPDPSVAKSYIGRKPFPGGQWDSTLADVAMAEGHNMLLSGDTGSGKTLFGEAYASKNGLMYYSIPCDVAIDPSALLGKMVVTETAGVYKWQDGPVTELVRHGGVLNISEVNMMPPRIAAVLYSLLDHRRYIVLLAHDGEIVRPQRGKLLIIADMNPNYRGTMELNAAFLNRWSMKLPWGYSDEVESKLLKFPTLREIAKKLRALSTDVQTPVSTNLLMEFEGFALHPQLSLDFAVSNFVAAFRADEQNPIKEVLKLHRTKLESDISYVTGVNLPVDDADMEEIEFDFEQEGK